ncbi:MAG TPA: hypothetical protein VGF01_04610 [Terracidiphilus sp.]
MNGQVKCYGEYPVFNYQVILGVCAFVNSWILIAATMGFPSREAGGLQMLYICGLYTIVILYRFIPLLTALYSLLPLLYPILGRWIAFPFFFRGISVFFLGEQWIFALVAIIGYVFHRIDLQVAAGLAREDVLDSKMNVKTARM